MKHAIAAELIDNEPVPCDDCPMRQQCAQRALCCKAFRRYANLNTWLKSWRGKELKPI